MKNKKIALISYACVFMALSASQAWGVKIVNDMQKNIKCTLHSAGYLGPQPVKERCPDNARIHVKAGASHEFHKQLCPTSMVIEKHKIDLTYWNMSCVSLEGESGNIDLGCKDCPPFDATLHVILDQNGELEFSKTTQK